MQEATRRYALTEDKSRLVVDTHPEAAWLQFFVGSELTDDEAAACAEADAEAEVMAELDAEATAAAEALEADKAAAVAKLDVDAAAVAETKAKALAAPANKSTPAPPNKGA